ncbi:hypothetical protein EGW08_007196 [Elysia chlorotica]|uniref:Innexin n=1 Tax=Elysia chlorotica TaxID=188477 RepID=A0A433TU42_ELYCH|nr:hypothetical protein EGW08_007196 [Elysia chlorotica]
MAALRRSLAEDKVDHYNHIWSVLFLLTLATVTWLLPLSPHVQPQSQPAASSASPIVISQVVSSKRIPRFEAQCWCPVEFTGSMEAYAQATCGAAYNLALQGVDAGDESIGASLYDIPMDNLIPRDKSNFKFKPNVIKSGASTPEVKVNNPQSLYTKQREKRDSARYFISTKTPFALFLLAICLKIPYLVWSLLSTLAGSINIDQTLSSAKAGTGLSHESRRQLHSELASAAADKVRTCSWISSGLYLLLKVLMCVAVIAELVVVHTSLLPQARSLEDDLNTEDPNSDMVAFVNTALDAMKGAAYNKSTDDKVHLLNQILLCELPIRQLQNVQTFLLQCSFRAEREPVQMVDSTPTAGAQSPQGLMGMYVSLYLIVQTFLVALTVVNVSSLLVWLLKLVAQPCGPTASLPVDARLLVYMAQENAGPEVVAAFSHSRVWEKGDGKESIPLSE